MIDQFTVTIIGLLLSVVMWLGGMLFSSRQPQGLAATVRTMQDIISNQQKEINELKALVKPHKVRFIAMIDIGEDVSIESTEAMYIESHDDKVTQPIKKKSGLGGMRS